MKRITKQSYFFEDFKNSSKTTEMKRTDEILMIDYQENVLRNAKIITQST